MAHRPSKTVRIAGRLVAKRSGSLFVRKELLSCYSRYSWGPFPLFSRFSCYSWVNYRLSNNLPFKHVVSARLDGDEPAFLTRISAESITLSRSRRELGP